MSPRRWRRDLSAGGLLRGLAEERRSSACTVRDPQAPPQLWDRSSPSTEGRAVHPKLRWIWLCCVRPRTRVSRLFSAGTNQEQTAFDNQRSRHSSQTVQKTLDIDPLRSHLPEPSRTFKSKQNVRRRSTRRSCDRHLDDEPHTRSQEAFCLWPIANDQERGRTKERKEWMKEKSAVDETGEEKNEETHGASIELDVKTKADVGDT